MLDQVAVDDKSNEITAIPILLDLLDLDGCTITIDAMGCQTEIADQIVQRGGNYVLALKGNQPTLYDDVQALFADARAAQQAEYGITSATETVMGHGRVETRTAYVISDPTVIAYLNEGQRWRDLASVALIEAQRTVNGTTTIEQRYYLLNQRLAAATVNDLVRTHRGIENQVHWVLDVVFMKMPAAFARGTRPRIWQWYAIWPLISCVRTRARAASKPSASALRLMMPTLLGCWDAKMQLPWISTRRPRRATDASRYARWRAPPAIVQPWVGLVRPNCSAAPVNAPCRRPTNAPSP